MGCDCPLPSLAALACLSLAGNGLIRSQLALLSPLFCEHAWQCLRLGLFAFSLMQDDIIYENDEVKEAIRRLPENFYDDREFRIKRALDMHMRQQILPKLQWTEYEDKFYLEPSLKEVLWERKGREE